MTLTPNQARRLLRRPGQTDADLIARLTNAELREVNTLRAGRITTTVRDVLTEVAETMETTTHG